MERMFASEVSKLINSFSLNANVERDSGEFGYKYNEI